MTGKLILDIVLMGLLLLAGMICAGLAGLKRTLIRPRDTRVRLLPFSAPVSAPAADGLSV